MRLAFLQVSQDSPSVLIAQREVLPVFARISAPLSAQETLQLLAAFQLLELLS